MKPSFPREAWLYALSRTVQWAFHLYPPTPPRGKLNFGAQRPIQGGDENVPT